METHGILFGFRFTRPDGIWYKTIGYTVDTNDPDGYAMGLIADIIPAEDMYNHTTHCVWC